MKEFEKWDKKEYPLPPTIERGPIGRDALKQRKHAWKAALRWALDKIKYSPSDISLIALVEEELSDE